MKKYYLSHPYTGNEEENRKEARELAAKYAKQFPDSLIVNPLDLMQCYEQAGGFSYQEILDRTLDVLWYCDGIIMTGDWEDSRGCMAEYKQAAEWFLEIYVEGEDLSEGS